MNRYEFSFDIYDETEAFVHYTATIDVTGVLKLERLRAWIKTLATPMQQERVADLMFETFKGHQTIVGAHGEIVVRTERRQ